MQRAEFRLELLKLTPPSFGPVEVITRAKMFEGYLFEPEPGVAPPQEPATKVAVKGKGSKKSENIDPLS